MTLRFFWSGLRVSHEQLHRILTSGLDWLAVQALEQDRRRRYVSAPALAEELQPLSDP